MLDATLSRWGYQAFPHAMATRHGRPCSEPTPLDWRSGLDHALRDRRHRDLLRNARANPATESTYVILLSSRSTKANIIEGLDAGADDYLAKPFDHEELQARIRVGIRTIELRQRLADRIKQHEEALSQPRASRYPADLLLLQEYPNWRRILAAGARLTSASIQAPS